MNVVPIEMNKPEPGTPLDYALRYAALGWHVFPVWGAHDGKCRCRRLCKSPGKHPVEPIVPHGQDDATTDPATIRRWWASDPQAGVAVFLARSGLMAIDIDPRNGGFETMDILEGQHGALVSDVLQYTQAGGEHRVFKLPSGMGLSLPGKLGPGVDVKVNGYIVLAPTRGVSGVYDWEASSDPLEGSITSPLPDWLRNLATVKQAAPALGPAVASRYVTEAQVGELRDALTAIPSDDRDVWVRIGLALCPLGQAGFDLWDAWSRGSDKYDPVDAIRVWRSLKPGQFNYESIFFLAQQSGWANPLAGNAPEISAERTAELKEMTVAHQKTPAADERFSLPIPVPALQAAADWMAGLYESPTHEISLAGALSLASVVCGRIYRSTNANWPSMMMVVSGPSGVGKNYIKVGVERLLVHAGLDSIVAGDFYTHQSAIYWALHRAPCHICISDEFGENFLEARKNNNSNKLTVFKALKKVYSDADHIFKPESYAMGGLSKKQREDMEMRPVINPALTLLGLTTPMQFFSEIKAAHIESGLINRFVIVNVENGWQVHGKRTSDAPPKVITDMIRRVRRVDDALRHTAHDLGPSPVIVQMTKGAESMFEDLKAQQEAACNALEAVGIDAMPRRWRENAMRLATAIAPWRNCEQPVIDDEIANFSIEYIVHSGRQAIDILRKQIGENDYQLLFNRVLEFVRESAGGVSDSELSRRFRDIKRREMADIKSHMVEAELIFQEKTTPGSGGGRPSTRWFSVAGHGDE